jgi:hypothetical protein
VTAAVAVTRAAGPKLRITLFIDDVSKALLRLAAKLFWAADNHIRNLFAPLRKMEPLSVITSRNQELPMVASAVWPRWQRNIVMDGSPHLPANIRQWFGDSRGHWEGNTLVVDVTNFTPKTDFQGSRENLHVVERWTRTSPTASPRWSIRAGRNR